MRLSIALAMMAAATNAATFNVNSFGHTVDAVPGNGVCADSSGQCTLRAAIMEANALAGADTIDLAPGATYVIATPDNAYAGFPVIASFIRINGRGATVRRSSVSGTPDFRLFWVEGYIGPASLLTLDQITLSDGTGDGGGALRVNYASAVIRRSTISGNSGFSGGGILNFRGSLTLENTTVSGNTSGDGFGGGGLLVFPLSGQITRIINSSIVENRAAAIPGFGGRGDAVAGGPIEVRGSILASPATGLGADCYGTVTSLGGNIASDASCALAGTGDRNSTNPMLGPLAYNGGTTQTHALLTGSPARDGVPAGLCLDASGAVLATDQRGLARPQGSLCDVGSLEEAAGVATWTPTGTMSLARFGQGIAALPSGKILVAGGHNFGIGYLGHSEVYDPGTGLWSVTASMPRTHRFTAVPLADGDVLMLGDDNGPPPTAYRYREGTGAWSNAGNPSIARFQTWAVLLPNGKVLVPGGYIGGCCIGPAGTYSSAEVYDPVANTWAMTPPMSESRFIPSVTLLANGKVLVAGGAQRDGPTAIRITADLFDPNSETWSAAAPMLNPRGGHTATRLASGKVLVAGGFLSTLSNYQASAELYDPATNTWTAAPPMATARARHAAVLLLSGKVLVAGGETSGGPTAAAEVYDPVANTWSAAPPMTTPRNIFGMALLPGGGVLAAGGLIGGSTETATAEIYQLGGGPDLTPPVITAPASVSVNATSPAGAVVNYVASATDNSGVVAAFGCVPPPGSAFPIGDTVVTCSAADGAGNLATKMFTVHVAGAAEQIANLKTSVGSLGLPGGIATSLLAKLNGTPNCGQLNAFINQVAALTGKALSPAQAAQLIAAASQIRAAMGC